MLKPEQRDRTFLCETISSLCVCVCFCLCGNCCCVESGDILAVVLLLFSQHICNYFSVHEIKQHHDGLNALFILDYRFPKGLECRLNSKS